MRPSKAELSCVFATFSLSIALLIIADYCWDLYPELMPAKFRKCESEPEKKKEPEVKAAVAKPGDGGGHTFTMHEMIEFAQEFAQRGLPTAEPTTPRKIHGRMAKIQFHD